MWIKENRNLPLANIMTTVKRKLIGHYNYYGITDNTNSMKIYLQEIKKLLFKWLNRRSQRKSYTIEKFIQLLEIINLPKPKIKVSIYAI